LSNVVIGPAVRTNATCPVKSRHVQAITFVIAATEKGQRLSRNTPKAVHTTPASLMAIAAFLEEGISIHSRMLVAESDPFVSVKYGRIEVVAFRIAEVKISSSRATLSFLHHLLFSLPSTFFHQDHCHTFFWRSS